MAFTPGDAPPKVVTDALAAGEALEDRAERAAQQRASRTTARQPLRSVAVAPKPKVVEKPDWVRPSNGRISSRFGPRWGRMHAGLDLAAPYGAPIRAAGAGKVVFAGRASGYGRLIKIEHADGSETAYGHMSRILVSEGEWVEAGQLIARIGSEGRSTGPHLHFEVRIGGHAINPLPWLRSHGVEI